MGDAIGVTFQQIHRYETGATRLSASRLVLLSDVLQIPVSLLVQAKQEPAPMSPKSVKLNPQPQLTELVQAFLTIEDFDVRAKFLELLQVMALACSSTANARYRG